MFIFETTCESVKDPRELWDMEARSRDITYQTFVRNVGRESLAREFPQYNWARGGKGIRLKNDPYVKYYKSYFRGKLCYGVDWSSIDHIWVKAA